MIFLSKDFTMSKTLNGNILDSYVVSEVINIIYLDHLQPEIPEKIGYTKGRIHSINNSKHDYLCRYYVALQLLPQSFIKRKIQSLYSLAFELGNVFVLK